MAVTNKTDVVRDPKLLTIWKGCNAGKHWNIEMPLLFLEVKSFELYEVLKIQTLSTLVLGKVICGLRPLKNFTVVSALYSRIIRNTSVVKHVGFISQSNMGEQTHWRIVGTLNNRALGSTN